MVFHSKKLLVLNKIAQVDNETSLIISRKIVHLNGRDFRLAETDSPGRLFCLRLPFSTAPQLLGQLQYSFPHQRGRNLQLRFHGYKGSLPPNSSLFLTTSLHPSSIHQHQHSNHTCSTIFIIALRLLLLDHHHPHSTSSSDLIVANNTPARV